MTTPHIAHDQTSQGIDRVADHFAHGATAGVAGSMEPALQNDAEFYANEYEDEEFEDYEEPSRMGGVVKLVATLSLAIITGAGLAYGYKYVVASDGAKKHPAIIRADSKPTKVQPKNPGGKKFAHTKKSIYKRVGAPAKPSAAIDTVNSMPGISLSGGAPRVPSGSAKRRIGNDGATRVRTVSVRPDGTYAPTKPLRPATPANINAIRSRAAGVSIPGITVGGENPAAYLRSKKPIAAARKSLTDELVKRVKKPAVRKPAVKIARVAPKASVRRAAPIVGTSPNGYVSQISSGKSRIDALSSFANLQQRYGSVLSNTQPDIQEANLGSKGVWYRLRIGPPGSKQAATDICRKLKAVGHKGCIVRSY